MNSNTINQDIFDSAPIAEPEFIQKKERRTDGGKSASKSMYDQAFAHAKQVGLQFPSAVATTLSTDQMSMDLDSNDVQEEFDPFFGDKELHDAINELDVDNGDLGVDESFDPEYEVDNDVTDSVGKYI